MIRDSSPPLAKEEALTVCAKISDIRRRSAARLSKEMKKALVDLNFQEVAFEIQVTALEEMIGSNGYDRAAFLISTNAGERLRDLAQVASGGELLRIMPADIRYFCTDCKRFFL